MKYGVSGSIVLEEPNHISEILSHGNHYDQVDIGSTTGTIGTALTGKQGLDELREL